MINKKTVNKLEFQTIISRYLLYCKTYYGKERFKRIEFLYDEEYLDFELNLLSELVSFVQKGNSFSLSGIPDISIEIESVKKGITLELESAYKVFVFLKNSNMLIDEIKKVNSPFFIKKFSINYDFENQVKSIKHIFSEDGQIADKATEELFSIRKKIRKAQEDFLNITSKIANHYKEFLVSENYILKEDRYLLPVKINKKGSVNGVVFGLSDSGKTILIEPLEIVQINNTISQLKSEEELEIGRILYKVTQIYINVINEIQSFTKIVGELDFVNSKATLAFENGFSRIEINSENIFRLNQFYHPLLEMPVKNNLEFGKDKQFVVITGPNTGGKSVTLKAIGLIQLLFQAGFFTPTSAGSTLPIMEDILIDIGDLQSIEQSLSTFSSHIMELKEIIEKASDKSLILIDELGTSTSPVEGEALAVSIIKNLIDKKSFGIVTSHFDLVKKFALENKSTIIASMCFDEELMMPKYVLISDVPGYSFALEMASRLGIPSYIVNDAKAIINEDKETITASRELSSLVLKYRTLLDDLEKKQIEISNKEKEIELIKQKFQKTAMEIEKQILLETNERINKLKKYVEEQIAILKKEGYSKELAKDIINEIDVVKNELIINLKKHETEQETRVKEIDNFKIGDIVETGLFGKKGSIIQIEGDKAKIQVESFIFEVPLSKLTKKEELNNNTAKFASYIPSKKLSPSIDIRGKTVEEARIELDIYFSEILNYQYKKIYIIHGKGTGKLSNFVQKYLGEKKKIVDSFGYASLSEGGAGCTIVILKQ